MTISRRFRRLLPLLLAALLAAACAHRGPHRGHHGFQSDVETIEIVSANVQGKNVYVPSTIVVVSGRPHTLSIYNTTDIAHGFAIDGLGIQEILPPGEEHAVPLPALEGHRVHHVRCHLHPPHRSGTLVVLPGR